MPCSLWSQHPIPPPRTHPSLEQMCVSQSHKLRRILQWQVHIWYFFCLYLVCLFVCFCVNTNNSSVFPFLFFSLCVYFFPTFIFFSLFFNHLFIIILSLLSFYLLSYYYYFSFIYLFIYFLGGGGGLAYLFVYLFIHFLLSLIYILFLFIILFFQGFVL